MIKKRHDNSVSDFILYTDDVYQDIHMLYINQRRSPGEKPDIYIVYMYIRAGLQAYLQRISPPHPLIYTPCILDDVLRYMYIDIASRGRVPPESYIHIMYIMIYTSSISQ